MIAVCKWCPFKMSHLVTLCSFFAIFVLSGCTTKSVTQEYFGGSGECEAPKATIYFKQTYGNNNELKVPLEHLTKRFQEELLSNGCFRIEKYAGQPKLPDSAYVANVHVESHGEREVDKGFFSDTHYENYYVTTTVFLSNFGGAKIKAYGKGHVQNEIQKVLGLGKDAFNHQESVQKAVNISVQSLADKLSREL